MSVEGFFRSLSKKVSQSIEEIKIKSNEATEDIARGMREIRDTTKAGVSKIGAVLQITETDAALYTDVDETAGMKLASHYSHVLATVRANNKILIEKGEVCSDALSRVERQTSKEHEHANALIKQCDQLPELVSSVDVIKTRCDQMLERLISIENMLGESWESAVVSQISAWKNVREAELQVYRQKKEAELQKEEEKLRRIRDAKLAEKRNKAIARSEQMEQDASKAHLTLQEQLDASIKQGMDDYLIYGFTSKSSSSTTSQGPSSTPTLNASKEETDKTDKQTAQSTELGAVQLSTPSEARAELDDFLGGGSDEAGTLEVQEQQKRAMREEEEEESAVKVDATTIESPELF